jgi:hypothetical protein
MLKVKTLATRAALINFDEFVKSEKTSLSLKGRGSG